MTAAVRLGIIFPPDVAPLYPSPTATPPAALPTATFKNPMSDGVRITDHDGVEWVVQEVSRFERPDGSGASSGVHPSWLAFRSEHELRLLHRYPRNWETLPPDELRRLFGAAVPQASGD